MGIGGPMNRTDVVEFLTGTPLRLASVVLGAWLLQLVLARLIRRFAATVAKVPSITLTKGTVSLDSTDTELDRRTQRAATVSHLLRNICATAVWVTAALIGLDTVGVAIGPLLASAGIVGVALGFGAQTLVKDYLAGIFIVIENQFGVGDVVDIDGVTGTVTDVGLRVTRLRGLDGATVWLRNGEILRVRNRSQGYSVAIVDIPVAYDTDMNLAQRVVEQALGHFTFDEGLIEEPTFAGVESVSGEAIFLRIIARTTPQALMPVQRELRLALKNAFDAASIVVPALPLVRKPEPPR
ncbi:MAG: mechanosensitive ion channel family protein [Actinobacteria bacterium]|nr:mechanosensitive ion channel family protein [Actinomycetota bacterium]